MTDMQEYPVFVDVMVYPVNKAQPVMPEAPDSQEATEMMATLATLANVEVAVNPGLRVTPVDKDQLDKPDRMVKLGKLAHQDPPGNKDHLDNVDQTEITVKQDLMVKLEMTEAMENTALAHLVPVMLLSVVVQIVKVVRTI